MELVRDVLENNRGVGLALLTHFTWELTHSKADALDFLLALHTAAPDPILHSDLVSDVGQQKAWMQEEFTQQQISCEASLEAAALRLLDDTNCGESWAADYELVTAGLSYMQAFRAPIRIQKFSYARGKPVPDCVEVAVREITEMLLFNPHHRRFDTSRLPHTAAPALRRFFEASNSRLEAGALGKDVDYEAAEEWFALCQNLPGAISNSWGDTGGHGLEYVSQTPEGKLFELKPTMRTISRALHQLLLGGSTESKPWDSLESMAQFWNERQPQSVLSVCEERVIRRSLVSEGSSITQKVCVWLDGASLHIELDPAKNMATCRHVRSLPTWAAAGSEVHSSHLARAFDGSRSRTPKEDALAMLRPAILGNAPLELMASSQEVPARWQSLNAVLSASYDEEYLDVSGFSVADMTEAEASRARRNVGKRVLRAIETATELAVSEGHDDDDDDVVVMARDSLPWLLQQVPADVSARELALALSAVTPEMLREDVDLAAAIEARVDGPVLSRMLEFTLQTTTLLGCFQGLGVRQAVDMARFVSGAPGKRGAAQRQ